jgi:hypothetical protein
MTWSGSTFDHVTMTTGSVAGHVMPGVTVPTFPRPALWDAQVAYKVQRAFEHCTARPAHPTRAVRPVVCSTRRTPPSRR